MTLLCRIGVAVMLLLLTASSAYSQVDPPAAPITTAREYFAAYGIDFGVLRVLVDGRELNEEEHDPLFQLLSRVPRIAPEEYAAWQKTGVQPERFEKDASDLRAEAMQLKGRIKQIAEKKLTDEQKDRYSFGLYFQAEMEIDGLGPAIVFLRDIPDLWKPLLDKPIDERVSLWGIFLKFGIAADGKRPPLYFAANRLAWHPDRENPALKVTPSLQLLGDLGVDVTLLNSAIDQQPLRSDEREAFYALLNAAAKADPAKLAKIAASHPSLAPLLVQPKEMRGQLVSVEGIVRRATKVMIDEPDIRQRYGIDHYFELVVFVPERIRYRHGKDGPEMLYDAFPVVCCIAKLPPEIPTDVDISETVRISGIYFKLYAYSSQFMQQQLKERNMPGELRQHSPLLLAPIVTYVPRPKAEENTMAGPLAFFVVTLVVVGAIYGFAQLRGSPADMLRSTTRIAPPEGGDDPPAEPGMPQIKSRPPNL